MLFKSLWLVLCAEGVWVQEDYGKDKEAPAGPQLELLFSFWTMRQETSAGLRSIRHNLDPFHHPVTTTTTQRLYKPTRLTSDTWDCYVTLSRAPDSIPEPSWRECKPSQSKTEFSWGPRSLNLLLLMFECFLWQFTLKITDAASTQDPSTINPWPARFVDYRGVLRYNCNLRITTVHVQALFDKCLSLRLEQKRPQ